MRDRTFTLLMLITLPLLTITGTAAGWKYSEEFTKHLIYKEAIDAGVGIYKCDPKTGESHFEWVKGDK